MATVLKLGIVVLVLFTASNAVQRSLYATANPWQTTRGPDDPPAKTEKKLIGIYIRLEDGQFEFVTIGLGAWNDNSEVLDFLSDEAIHRQLELTAAQTEQLGILVKGTREAMKNVTQGVAFLGEQHPDVGRALAEETNKFRDELNAIFFPHQQTALEQLLLRLHVRKFGWVREILTGELGNKLDLTPEQRSAFSKAAGEIALRIRPEVDQARREYGQKFIALLSPQQQATFAPLGEDFLERRLPPLEAIARQLQNVEFIREQIQPFEELPYVGLTAGVTFTIGFDGRLAPFNPTLTPRQRDLISRLAPVTHFSEFHALLTQSWLRDELQISEAQQAEITAMFDGLNQMRSEAMEQYGDLSGDARRTATEQMHLATAQHARACLDRLSEILMPHQVLLLQRIAEMAELIRMGFPIALLYGQLGQRLEITARQKDRILELAEEIVQSIERRALEWEERIENELRSVFDVEQRAELDRLLGPKPKHVPANIDLMLEQLTNPFGRNG